MQDERIVDLYWQRDEAAIRETKEKYHRYLSKIACGILANPEDSEECVSDTYLRAWNSLPPHRPQILATYLGKITRRLSIDHFRSRHRAKRQASEYTLSLSELEECVSGPLTTEDAIDLRLLGEAINAYLASLSAEACCLFIGRYYYMDSIRELTAYYRMSESKVKSMLYRTRQGLKTYLEQEGFPL